MKTFYVNRELLMLFPYRKKSLLAAFCLLMVCCLPAIADERKTADEQLAEYFENATAQIEKNSQQALADIEDWKKNQEVYREQLAEMLGISPRPERTPLHVTVTKTIELPDLTVKNLHYQAMPGLYITGNLYLPKETSKPCPAILYVCGHSVNRKDGVSYGNKFGYHQHGLWYARNGYVCLTIDTIQLGEIPGIHHGTHNLNMWWWNARGYTPAGVETWAGMRGIDYLQSLPEVDPELIGVTGRSGGGGYSWYIAAMDTRVKAAVPVAGITSMRNHIVDGCIAGHCDCMFMFNTYAWDFPQVAALIAPRALLLTNTDKDPIFPVDGVFDVYMKTRHVYRGLGAGKNFGIALAEGPHTDTQRLQVNSFEWFNRFLKKDQSQAMPTEKSFQPEDLRVFQELPADERSSKIHETFIPLANPAVPANQQEWTSLKEAWKKQLLEKSFAAWPDSDNVSAPVAGTAEATAVEYTYSPQDPFQLKFHLLQDQKNAAQKKRPLTILLTHDSVDAAEMAARQQEVGGDLLIFSPRGLGVNAWSADDKAKIHIRRRFALLGQSLDGMRLWDVCQLIRSVQQLPAYKGSSIRLAGTGDLAGIALYVPVFGPEVQELELTGLPSSHREGPIFLNVLKTVDIPQMLAVAAEQSRVILKQSPEAVREYVNQTAAALSGSKFSVEAR